MKRKSRKFPPATIRPPIECGSRRQSGFSCIEALLIGIEQRPSAQFFVSSWGHDLLGILVVNDREIPCRQTILNSLLYLVKS